MYAYDWCETGADGPPPPFCDRPLVSAIIAQLAAKPQLAAVDGRSSGAWFCWSCRAALGQHRAVFFKRVLHIVGHHLA
jgi:hypothetical protein